MADLPAKINDVAEGLAWKLRLKMLNKTQRTLMKNKIINYNGFLTVEGAQVFLDALWQANPKLQEDIAEKLAQDDKKKCD